MAVRWDVNAKEYERGSTYKFLPEEIIVEPGENGRHDEPDIEWMIADIYERGQETPVTVRSDGGKPVLVFGFQRLRAIKAINSRHPDEPQRKVVCVYKQLTKEEAFRANISENRMRNDTTLVDDAHNIKRLINVYGYSDERVIDAYFPALPSPRIGTKAYDDARRWVRERMALIGLTPKAEQAVKDGRLKLHTAIKVNKLPAAKQDQMVDGKGWVKAKDVEKATGKNAPTKKKRRTVAGDAPATLLDQIEDAQSRRWAKNASEISLVELGAHLVGALAEELFCATRDRKERPELIVLADAILDAAAQTSICYEFPSDVIYAMEAYRKARVA